MKRILIIDDEKDFCYFVRQNLELSGDYEVRFATNGRAGLQIAGKFKPDLILLDVMMPGMNGLDVLKKLKENKSTLRIPVVFLTAKTDTETKQLASSLYNEAYIEKPVETLILREKIEKILSRFGVKSEKK